jgi:O-antigen ligase
VTARFRSAVAPAYLFLCLLLGGSPQGVWGSAILQLIGVAIISWALIERREEPLPKSVRQLLAIVSLGLLIVLIQLVPLPVGIWTALPGREVVVAGFGLLGLALPAMPLSLAPYESVATSLALLPPIGMLAAILGLRAYSGVWLSVALIAGAMAGVLLGILQVSSPIPEASPWYLYRVSNFGVATGFFANSNHMATLLLVMIPFVAAIGATVRQRSKDARMSSAGVAVACGGLLLAVLGLALNRSLAGYGLGVPVVLASLTILFGLSSGWMRGAVVAIGLTVVGALALLWVSPVGSQMDRLGAATSVTSRQEISKNSLELAENFAPVGSGIGTFAKLYPITENPDRTERVYVNHAHNDYLELAIETGVSGALLIVLFLFWWSSSVLRMLMSPAADQYALAGAIASAAILLHSLVDYPLRTAAISVVFAMALALIVQSRRVAHSDDDLRPTRHLVVVCDSGCAASRPSRLGRRRASNIRNVGSAMVSRISLAPSPHWLARSGQSST